MTARERYEHTKKAIQVANAFENNYGGNEQTLFPLIEDLLDVVDAARQRPGLAWCRQHCSCVTYIDGVLTRVLEGK